MSAPTILILAGEISGDQHAARLLRAMKRRHPGLRAWGMGGDELAAEGMDLRRHTREMAVMGLAEVLRRYGFFRKVFHELVAETRANPPDLILLVDYPGFNLRFAAAVRDLGVPIVQYVCPQVWAWKPGRIPKMVAALDRVVCIFPFEPAIFDGTGLDAVYCGHPLVEETEGVTPDPDWGDGPKLALLPGSRRQEIERLFEPMARAAAILRGQVPGLEVRVAAATAELAADMSAKLRDWGLADFVEIVTGKTRALVKGADAALVTSGTATLETALLGTPLLVVYKTSPLTYAIGKRVLRVPHIGMANIVMQKEICPEYIQERASPENLAEGILPLLKDSPARRAQLAGIAGLREKLVSDEGGEDPARAILDLLAAK